MEYSLSNQSSSLGTYQIQGILASTLNNEKYTAENKKTNVVFEPKGHFFAPLAENNDFGFIDTSNDFGSIDTSNNDEIQPNNEDENKDEKENRFQFIKDPINSFFIGSITVVGLFVLYRLLQKNK